MSDAIDSQKPKVTGGKMSPKKLTMLQRDAEILRLRLAGNTYEEIAEQIDGIKHKASVFRALKRILDRSREKYALQGQDLLELELARTEKLLNGIWDRATDPGKTTSVDGHTKALNSALKILDRRAKYLGLDKPTEIKHSGDGPGGAIKLYLPDNGRDPNLKS